MGRVSHGRDARVLETAVFRPSWMVRSVQLGTNVARGVSAAVALLMTFGLAGRAEAQTADFLFGRPDGSIGVRGEWLLARAESDIYDFTTELLTVARSDFNAPGLGVDVGFGLTSRVDAVAGFEFSRAVTFSEYRDFVDLNDLPIEQTTALSQVDLTGSLKLALTARGRQIGQYAWVPAAVVPYVGGGGGFIWYRFEQEGDFVDFLDNSIFTDRFESHGWSTSAHLFGGAEISLTQRLALTSEARYVWADATLTQDFTDFDPIDLSGLRITVGVQFTY